MDWQLILSIFGAATGLLGSILGIKNLNRGSAKLNIKIDKSTTFFYKDSNNGHYKAGMIATLSNNSNFPITITEFDLYEQDRPNYSFITTGNKEFSKIEFEDAIMQSDIWITNENANCNQLVPFFKLEPYESIKGYILFDCFTKKTFTNRNILIIKTSRKQFREYFKFQNYKD